MQYQPYPEYGEVKEKSLGKKPVNWESRRLKFSIKLKNIKINAKESDLEYMGMENIESFTGRKIFDEENPITSEGVGSLFEENDVLFGKLRPYLAKSYLCKEQGFCSTELLVFEGKKLLPKFLQYMVLSDWFVSMVDSSTYGAKMPRASWDFIGNLESPLPPEAEQEVIVNFLDRKTRQIDQLIEKKKALIEKLDEQRIAVITRAVTKGINENAKMKPSSVDWLGDIPEHWKVEKLKYSIHMKGGGTPNTSIHEYWNGDIPWVSPKDMKSDLISNTEDYITELGLKNSSTTLVDKGELLMVVRSGILRHSIPVSIAEKQVSLNQDMKALITDKNKLLPHFLKEVIWSNQKSLLPLWSKPGCTVESIETEYMANTKIALPPLSEQAEILKKIEEMIAPIDKMVTLANKSISLYKSYRSALITNAVTGKIDLRNVEVGE
ncbi:MAG: restriction endonuclease subunit S [Alteromonadaceae bacterium]|nr:restriction endonuclease subunit S [Alteromonadaceae bacterium]